MLLLLLLPTCTAHDDYLPLRQPEVIESPCVKRWSTFGAYFGADADGKGRHRPIALENEPSELHVNLTVRLDRFESRYVGFNTRTYNGRFPPPTIKVCPGDKLIVRVVNALGDGSSNMTNLHVHGMHVSPKGHHDNVLKSIEPGADRVYEYDIRPDHPAGTFWYHPHSHGLVNTQLSGLMAGSLIVADRPGEFPTEIAAMDDLVLILQGICVENCHLRYDSIVHALNNDYDDDDGDGDGDEDDASADDASDEFPIDLRVDRNSPLNDTSLLHVYVNGQYLPEIHMKPGELKRLRYINAIPNNVAELVAPGCEMHVLARDGVYVRAPAQKGVVVMPPGSRADVAVRCAKAGTFFVETESSPKRNHLLGQVGRHRVPSQKIVSLRVLGDDDVKMAMPEALPKPPVYMSDLQRLDTPLSDRNRYNYEFSVWMDAKDGVTYGVNRRQFHHEFVNHTMHVDEPQEWELSVRGYGPECAPMNDPEPMDHRSNLDFPMDQMLDAQAQMKHDASMPMPGHKMHCHAMTHPFHMHGSHFQITRVDKSIDPDELLFGVGEWRDTIPLYKSDVQIRFTPRRHMLGRILTHCHFAAHSDNGMAQLIEKREYSPITWAEATVSPIALCCKIASAAAVEHLRHQRPHTPPSAPFNCTFDTMATEKQKMIKGELYNALDPELEEDRKRIRSLVQQFNDASAYSPESVALMGEMLGSKGEKVIIEAPFRCDYGYNIHLGDSVFMNFNCVLLDVCEIRIGARTLLGPGVQVYTASHPLDPEVRKAGLENGRPVTIEEDVWIGGNAIILPGVRIGRGAVVGAGSVVTKDVPPMSVVAGNPARFIKSVVPAQE
ncbi:hypothetical protein ATCC90586_003308 [Pythium insidiosum]|nr:hypothetical protein ATCC90586_003308 [Pythium insidiosum]